MSYPEAAIDYINICDPKTLEDIHIIQGAVVMALAVAGLCASGTTR